MRLGGARLAGVLVIALVLGAAAVAVALRPEPALEPEVLSREEARDEAQAACADFRRVERLVAANAPGVEVFGALDSAVDHAAVAARNDVVWVSLHSGLRLLQAALPADAPESTRLAVDVIRPACERAA